jgi:hypothetical protein
VSVCVCCSPVFLGALREDEASGNRRHRTRPDRVQGDFCGESCCRREDLRQAVELVGATPACPLHFCFVVIRDSFASWTAKTVTVNVQADVADRVRFYVVNIFPVT